MKIIPLAFDSLGTRSMATYVEAEDCKILIDPAVSLAGRRYGYPPHPLEIKRMDEHWAHIKGYASISDVLIITHYHYDHHNPEEPEIFRDKIVFIKHPREYINKSQLNRADFFLSQIKGLPKELHFSDSKEFTVKGAKIRFSEPVPHGPTNKLGYVTEVSVFDGSYKLVHTSDIQGGILEEQVKFLLEEDPDFVIIDGPMFGNPLQNMVRVILRTKVRMFLIEHHYLRDLKWKDKLKELYIEAEKKGVQVLSSAEFLGLENDLLEAKRKQLYKEYPVE
ncbi:MAG: hypothetical protein QME40_06705 [bacterium]|nr:hypothetical protein [bacterium]